MVLNQISNDYEVIAGAFNMMQSLTWEQIDSQTKIEDKLGTSECVRIQKF